MREKPLSPRYDVVFKSIFGEKHVTVLSDFLQTVLALPAEEFQGIQMLNPYLFPLREGGKLGILDLRVKTRNGNNVHIELQVSSQPSIWKRIEYYNASLLIDQLSAGDDYDKICPAITILISYPVLIKENDKLHHVFLRYDKVEQICLPGSTEIHVLEVQKVQKRDDSPLANWLQFFAAETEEDYEMAAQTRPAIAEAWGVIQHLSADQEARLKAEYEEKARRDEADRMKGAYREGLQEGLISVIRNAVRKGMGHADIADLTGLSLEQAKQYIAKFA